MCLYVKRAFEIPIFVWILDSVQVLHQKKKELVEGVPSKIDNLLEKRKKEEKRKKGNGYKRKRRKKLKEKI